MRLDEVKDMRVYAARLIVSKFKNCLAGIQYEILQQYNYNKIRIDNEDGSLYLWVGLIWNSQTNTFRVDISNITLPERYRHCGLFKNMVNTLLRSKYVDSITVSNVLTKEMDMACKSLNMEYMEQLNTYLLKKKK